MTQVRRYTKKEAEQIDKSPVKYSPNIDADGNFYLSIKTAKSLSQIEGFEWAAPDEINESNLIPYKPVSRL